MTLVWYNIYMKKGIVLASIGLLLIASMVVATSSSGQQKLTSLNRRIQSVINEYKPKEPIPTASTTEEEANAILQRKSTEEGVIDRVQNAVQKPAPSLPPPPSSYRISTGIQQEYQTWNNCGPATTTMMLRQLGEPATQAEIAQFMKPNPDDKNVSPEDIIRYLTEERELNALFLHNGDDTVLKQLVSRGYPVIVEQWFEPHPNDGMGHYRLVVGYDDATKLYTTMDSYIGPNKTFSYKEFNDNWKVFNYAFITIYDDGQEEEIKQILGGNWNPEEMNRLTQERAVDAIDGNEKDAFAWYNLGTSYSRQGKHKEAAVAFDKARQIGLPWRMLWYQFEIFESYLAEGRYEDVISLTNANLKNTSTLEESFYYRGRAYEGQGKTEEAKRDYQRAVELNKNFTPPQERL